ncbi:putative protein K02A2.6-like protein [Labeo rohita]|uniref:ribonuclease H n=1 Tax=Labeo rohita TaxID=84645 RepID=A0A498L734_LABRO|nr:putative protein K02A2.6-like protein [Labeo rohita]
MYTGEIIPILGAVTVKVAYGSQRADARLLVVKGTGQSLLGWDWLSKIKLNWGEIRLIRGLHAEDVVAKYPAVFKDELGTLKGTFVKLCVEPSATPCFFKPRSVPFAMKHKVEKELERLQQLGIIESIQFSDWAAPIVPVLKEDGTVRICGDYKLTINQAAKLETYPIPRVEDLFSMLAGGKTFTKLYMSHAYQQLLLDEESKQYVTINTHKGLFKYNRLVFGVASSLAIFQRTMESLLRGIPHVAVYLNDILITGKTEEEHLSNLDQVLKRMSEAGLRLKQGKCTFQAESVTYLGHQISAQGLYPMPEKVRAIKEAPKPGNVSELKSFLGMVTYYGKVLPDLSTVLAPLYQLLHRDCQWKWGAAQVAAFTKVKNLLQSARVLVHFDPEKDLTVSCDASPYGIGAVLSHVMEEGSEKPIAFASRTLTKAERGSSQLDKEGLAIVFAVKRFHQFLYGRPFTVFTGHKPLMSLFSDCRSILSMASAHIQRWALTLSTYQYRIVYQVGKENANVDALSWLPLPVTPASTPLPPETVFLLEKLNDSPYRITPQTTTGLVPAEMLMGQKPKSCLDLLRPNVEEKVRVQQGKQKAWHDRHAREQSFQERETVFVRNFARGQRWLPGAIVKKCGPRSCVVRLDGRDVRRHQDHLRSCPAKEQWGCFNQTEGSGNEGSSASEEVGAPPLWIRIVCLRGRFLVQSPSSLSIVRMDESQSPSSLSIVRMDESQSPSSLSIVRMDEAPIALRCENGRGPIASLALHRCEPIALPNANGCSHSPCLASF